MNVTQPHVLVTGGAGFIGSHLVERLLADGKRVTVIDDFSTGRTENLAAVANHPALTVLRHRVSKCPDLTRLVAQSESIYHLASSVGVDLVLQSCLKTVDNTVRETEILLEAASRYGTPILLASTSEVYGKSQKSEFSEDDDLLIGSPKICRWSYACSKLMDEFLVLAHGREKGTPVVITRLFNTVGPRQTGHYGMVLPRFIQAARKGEPLRVFGGGRQTRCFCFVKDTIEALVRLQNTPSARGDIFNVGSSEEVSILALAQSVLELSGSASRIEHVPYSEAYPAGFEDMLRRKPNVKKLQDQTGFRPSTSLREIITVTLAES